MFEISGKSIAITGAGGALGGFLALELSKLGAKISVLDIDEKAANAVVAEIAKIKGNAIAVKCNVLEKPSLLEAREKVLEEFGKIDALLNAAGGNNPKATTEDEQFSENSVKNFFNLETEGLQFVLNLNVLSAILASQVFAEKMNAGSVIINFSSMNSFRPLTKIPAYSAAKAAVSNFTQWLANYLAKKQIRVNAIAPGFFLTKQNEFLLSNSDGSLTDRGKKILAHTPMERFGNPEDLLGTIVWLLSEESKFVTGIIVPVDGGFSAYSGV